MKCLALETRPPVVQIFSAPKRDNMFCFDWWDDVAPEVDAKTLFRKFSNGIRRVYLFILILPLRVVRAVVRQSVVLDFLTEIAWHRTIRLYSWSLILEYSETDVRRLYVRDLKYIRRESHSRRVSRKVINILVGQTARLFNYFLLIYHPTNG